MAGDIRIEVGFLDHPKTALMRRRIGPGAAEHVMRLWFYAASQKPDGDLSGVSDEMIEIAAGWTGEPGKLVAALVELRYIDGEAGARQIHDWIEHQPWVVKRDDRIQAAKNAANTMWERRRSAKYVTEEAPPDAGFMRIACGPHAEGMPGACAEHASRNAPNPTQPNPTQPNPTQPNNKHTSRKKRSKGCSVEFEEAWMAYPSRPGQSKSEALKAWTARINAGVDAQAMIAGVQRYANYCKVMGTEPQFIKHAATFFGPDRHFESNWATPVAINGKSPPQSENFADRDYGKGIRPI